MLKNLYLILISFVLLLGLSQCSTEKDKFVNRTFHQTTTRFNGYFHAKESMNEAKMKLESDYKADYTKILPIFIDGDEEASRSIYPQMDRVIEKTSNVIERHSMIIKGKEKNKWIDENWVLMAQAHYLKRDYFKAEELLLYVKRKYKKSEERFLANIWLGRTHIAMEKFSKVKTSFAQMEDDKDFPEELKGFFYLAWADYYLKQEENKKAIETLEDAIVHTKKKKDRIRPTFILAQLFQEEELSNQAIKTYNRVIKMRPKNYEFEFYSQINQALAYERRGGDSEAIKAQLERMLKDDKNIEYQDQIYYALADIYLEERRKNEGMDLLNQSIRASIDNDRQKGTSYLRLADIYFEDQEYTKAQAYYDSTAAVLPADYPDFEEIKAKGDNLTSLVDNLNIVLIEDSLQLLGKMDSIPLMAQLEKVREGLIEEEREKARKEREAIEKAQKAANKAEDTKGKWYFYNSQTKAIGYQDFLKKWGERKLGDNWRRSNKASNLDSFEELSSTQQDSALNVSSESNVPSVESMYALVPKTPQDYSASHKKIAEALYNAGVIYKNKLNDIDNAIGSFEAGLIRYDNSEYTAISAYQLYRAYVTKRENGEYQVVPGERDNIEYYKNYILQNYPNSDYALLIQNPEWDGEAQLMKEQEAYEATFDLYKRGSFPKVLIACNTVLQTEPENHFLPEYHFMKALAIGNLGDKDNYIKNLVQVVEIYSETEEAVRAQEILKLLGQEAPIPVVEDKLTEEGGEAENETLEEEKETETFPYKFNALDEHYFALIYPNEKGNVNEVKVAVSKFNTTSFKLEKLRITNSFINKKNQIIIVRKFENLKVGMDYFKAFNENKEALDKVNEAGYATFIVSRQNFTTLFKMKDVEQYQRFFNLNYTE